MCPSEKGWKGNITAKFRSIFDVSQMELDLETMHLSRCIWAEYGTANCCSHEYGMRCCDSCMSTEKIIAATKFLAKVQNESSEFQY